ncbi:hypothetical protein, partial [Streptomyces chryseus]
AHSARIARVGHLGQPPSKPANSPSPASGRSRRTCSSPNQVVKSYVIAQFLIRQPVDEVEPGVTDRQSEAIVMCPSGGHESVPPRHFGAPIDEVHEQERAFRDQLNLILLYSDARASCR